MISVADVFDEFSRRCGRVCIAGGSVRDELMGLEPKDFDVFVFDEILPIQFDGLEVIEVPEWHKSEPFLVGNFRWRGAWIQVMRTDMPDVEALVDSFDWNVCMFAYDGTTTAQTDIDEIGEGKTLRLHKVTFPLATLRRGFRFSERFKMKLERDDISHLCAQVVLRRCKVASKGESNVEA